MELSRTPAEPLALPAVVISWIGAGLTLPYYRWFVRAGRRG